MLDKKFQYSRLLLAITVSLGGIALANATCIPVAPKPGPNISTVSADGKTTTVITPEGAFPPQDPFLNPPGSNHLETRYDNYCDSNGVEILNTVPSTPEHPYNLHPDPVVSEIDKTSPSDDLVAYFKKLVKKPDNMAAAQRAIDILEGNPMPGKSYSGFPILHYNGPNKVKTVEPIYDASHTKVIGGIVNVHQIWYDGHIESDAGLIDPSAVMDVPWTIHYTVDTLNRGHEDFAPMVMYTDDPALSPAGSLPKPNVMMDQTFFPMNDGTRTVYEIAMAQGKYYNLSYHWGWRKHPPRVQVMENKNKVMMGMNLLQWEQATFGEYPTRSEAEKLAAIAKIGDLAPEKRMWNTLRAIKVKGNASKADIAALNRAYDQWQNRTQLPDGVKPDPDSDWTLFYANNTIYGQLKGNTLGGHTEFPDWTIRGKKVKIKLLNGDHFIHAYVNVDFGGRRGWENTFQSTKAIAGAGQWFTFGRANWWMNAGAPPNFIMVPEASGLGASTVVGEHNVELTLNFEPSRRIRFYQFDPLHHDTAIWSIH